MFNFPKKKKQTAIQGLISHLSSTIPGFDCELKPAIDPDTCEEGMILYVTKAAETDILALSTKIDSESERFLGDIFSECPAFSTIVRLRA